MLKEEQMREKKKKILKLGRVFLIVMVLITFFSKSMNSWLLPNVVADKVASGKIKQEIIAEGTVKPTEVASVYGNETYKISKLHKQAGDTVEKGDLIYSIDAGDFVKQMDDLKLDYAIVENEYRQLENDRATLINDEKEQLDEAYKTAKAECKKLEAKVDQQKELYEIGAITRSDYEEKKELLDAEKQKELELAKAVANYTENISSKLQNLELSLENKALKLQKIDNEIVAVEEALSNEGILAEGKGMLIEINYKAGDKTNTQLPLYQWVADESGVVVEFEVDGYWGEFLALGDEIKIEYADEKIDAFIISSQKRSEGDFIFSAEPETMIALNSSVEIKMRLAVGDYNALVPSASIFNDSKGESYVYVIENEAGAFGDKFIIEKRYVTIGNHNDENTGILSGLNANDPIVLYSDSVLADGAEIDVEEDRSK